MTLSEILVASALSGVVLAGTYSLLDQGLRTYAIGAARVDSQQAARAALERIAREIRLAGRGPDVDAPALAATDPSRVVITADLDADGALTTRGEVITWQLVDSVVRRDAGAGAQPVVNGVRALGLRYFDALGELTTDPAAVRVVDVTIVTGSSGPTSGMASGLGTELHTRVRLRNR